MTIVNGFKQSLALRAAVFFALSFLVVGASRSSERWNSFQRTPPTALLGVPSASEEAAESRELIAFFEERVRRDPGDADVYSKLAGLYLQRLRETGALEDLGLALHAARTSLAIVPAVRNTDGLTALAQAEFAAHEFRLASAHARQLAKLDYTGAPYALLGDALTELGDYGRAERAYEQLWQRSGGNNENVATRMARSAQLRGDTAGAVSAFSRALELELMRAVPSRERIAWFEWQLGDIAFFSGDDSTAELKYNAALAAYPGSFRARASLGRLRAAQGDLAGGIHEYEAAIRLLPDPTFVAELGDLYKLSGREVDARNEYGLVELIAHLSRVNGIMYNRQVAMFYADHDLRARDAYADAKREYAVRRDILGADALAWTALKAGHVPQADVAMKAALSLGTQDPRLFYHAGMIARAQGNRTLSRAYLRHALALNPQFDPLQVIAARAALAE